MKTTDKTYSKWIKKNKKDFKDPVTKGYDYTGMAEALAEKFDLYVDRVDYIIPDDVFDIVGEI